MNEKVEKLRALKGLNRIEWTILEVLHDCPLEEMWHETPEGRFKSYECSDHVLIEYVCGKLGCSEREVINALCFLEKRGLIFWFNGAWSLTSFTEDFGKLLAELLSGDKRDGC